MKDIGTLVDELTYKVIHEKASLWEEKLKLYIKPKPTWMPMTIYKLLLDLVFIQTIERK